ncbi:unnamed protein product [Paramecium pentaurelia]|uniref:Uncharacterized protein n=1 Tax=Paramecium pentaurelia TaxID=43138 RepID=A0A8S1TBN8_9CILI|nr:unnamed protein product [Paramecium pentaurelia]
MKNLIVICFLTMVLTQQVKHTNQCNDCGQLKSQNDCEQETTVTGACEWVAASGTTPGKCQKKTTVDPVTSFKPYCELIDKPETDCAKTFGCSYIDMKCTHFTGCQAYIKTTTTDCQAIQYLCVSDGNTCIQAKECKEYTQQQCESTPSVSGILKCKWDTNSGACRDYACSEADDSLNTDEKCSAWLAGCVTKGQGCVNTPRPACATYTGDDVACQSFIGSDGNCELATGTTNCKAKECVNAPTSLSSDDDCKAYQKGCITTGKGCVLATTKPLCSTYSGNNTTCLGYIGSDDVCEGDAGGSKCRARKCENGAFNTDELFQQYQSTCRTNGKNCVSAFTACNTYKGTATTCAVYDEAPDTTTTDDACNKYQIGCVTTGKGCVTKTNLKSCTTYDGDATSCQSRVGSEGKCTWKTGTKCVARDCTQAATNLNTNPLCANFFTNCVNTGSGCVSQTTCDLTVKQQSCEGTNNCSWQPLLNLRKNQYVQQIKLEQGLLIKMIKMEIHYIFLYYKIIKFLIISKKCGWLNNSCKELSCSDLTGAYYNNDSNCAAELSICISNRIDTCITKYECSKLSGTQSTCLSYPGYCTNSLTATDTTPCIQRKCSDNTEATDNATCASFLPGCISNGKGCVDYTTPCTSMKGTQETCNKIFAYKTGSIDNFTTNQCYNSSTATENDYCKIKTCKLAENQNDGTCGSFLEGCVYNGNGGCVDPKAIDTTCASYTGVLAFCESAIVGSNSSKYCFGTSTAATCTVRACTDNITATKDEDCESFMSGCIAKSDGGCISRQSRSCSQQSGTVITCPNFSGGLQVSSVWTRIACTKYDTCQDRLCSDKKSPQQAQDCLDYKSTCRFFKVGSACIDVTACSSYSLPDTATNNQQKFDYCTSIKDNVGFLCGYTQGATKCSARTCDQFLSTYTTLSCITYLQKNISTLTEGTCKLAGKICYLVNPDCEYSYASTDNNDSLKLTQCRKFVNVQGHQCTFKTGDTKCSLQDTCEKLNDQTDARTCNTQNNFQAFGECQKVTNSNCLSLSKDCSSYKFDSTLTTIQKQQLCWGLWIIVDRERLATPLAEYKKCVFKAGSSCDAITNCLDIYSASSQRECQGLQPGCLYFGGKCNAAVSSGNCPSTFPTGITTDSQKSLYCRSIKEASDYCRIKSDKSQCELANNANCAGITIPTSGSWDSISDPTSNAFKSSYCLAQSYQDRSKLCKYTSGSNCSDATCADISSPTGQGDCDNYISGCIYFNNKCYAPGSVESDGDCADNNKVPMDSGLTATQKLAYCQLYAKSYRSIFCTFDQFNPTPQTQCVVGSNCNAYTELPNTNDADESIYCLNKVNKIGRSCAFTVGDTTCREFDCQDIKNPISQIDCDLGSQGGLCAYQQGVCYNWNEDCQNIPALSGNEQIYCESLLTKFQCTYISGTKCTDFKECHLYSVTENQASICAKLTDGTDKCTYISGNNCVLLGSCESYDGTGTAEKGPAEGSEEIECKAVKSYLLIFKY